MHSSIPSYNFLFVPRETWKPRTKMSLQKCNVPDGARGCLDWLHKEQIKNIWGQQRAILQSPRPTGELIHLIKSIEGIWALLGEQRNGRSGGRIRHRTSGATTGGIVQKKS